MADAVHIDSDNIKVYPSGYRKAEVDLEASRTTEGSVTKANSFALGNTSYAKWDNDGNLAFSLDGYLAVIEGQAALDALIGKLYPYDETTNTWKGATSGSAIYAILNAADIDATVSDSKSIKLRMMVNPESGRQTDVDYAEANADKTSFRGISFSRSEPTLADNKVSLKVLEYDSAKKQWAIPDSSRLNVTTEQIRNGAGSKLPISQKFSTKDLHADNLATYSDYTVKFGS